MSGMTDEMAISRLEHIRIMMSEDREDQDALDHAIHRLRGEAQAEQQAELLALVNAIVAVHAP